MAKTYGSAEFGTLAELIAFMNLHKADGTPLQVTYREVTDYATSWVLIYYTGS